MKYTMVHNVTRFYKGLRILVWGLVELQVFCCGNDNTFIFSSNDSLLCTNYFFCLPYNVYIKKRNKILVDKR